MPSPIDLSFPLGSDCPTFPGDPAIRITPVRTLERGDPYRLSTLALGSHSGTHLDAPAHFVPGGVGVDDVDLTLLNGPAWVVEVPDDDRTIGPSTLADLPPGTRRVLLKSSNSARWASGSDFFDDFVALGVEGAELLAARGVGLVGVDGLSVERDPTRTFPVHHLLLGRGIWILEGLRLHGVVPGGHELGCLPLRLPGADGSPVRAVLWE